MTWIQILLVFFGLFMMYVARIHFKKDQITRLELGVWWAMWLAFIFVNILPESLKTLAQGLHVARVFDLLVILALMILTVVMVLNRFALRKMEQRFEDLVRSRTLKEASRGKE